MNIVLFEPEIPMNTGNIGRSCVLTGSKLHLIKPLGFDIGEKAVKRAGLDYWQHLELYVYENIEDFYEKNPNANIYYASSKGKQKYSDVNYLENDYIMFGKESKGLPKNIVGENFDKTIRIPMDKKFTRSLNLSVSAAIVLYEGLRQLDFPNIEN